MLYILIGYGMDLLIGDPYWLYHPVRLIGHLIKALERVLLSDYDAPFIKKLKGTLFMFLVTSITFFIVFMLLKISFMIHPILGASISVWAIYQGFATKCLDVETKKVYKALLSGDLIGARVAVSFLVSRDTDIMTEEDVIKACIETIAENLADGVVAPIFYAFLGGPALLWYYKSVNTLDSMVGYKNDQYHDFGWASAKWDDVMNYIPARLTALFILVATLLLRWNVKNSWRILLRDRRNHASPNSAYPESAAAGALEIQIGGKASYFGVVSEKLTMGDALKPIEVSDIKKMSVLMFTTSLIAVLSCAAVQKILELMI